MATKKSHLLRPLVALVALVAAMAAILIAYNASPAHAALDSCTTTAGTTTCTFLPSGSEDTFEVPLGVSSIHVVATGAPGAVGTLGGTAGRGAQVSGDLTATPGQLLYVNVGGAPTGRVGCANIACVGGFNGGGSSLSGGGGGGASDVRTVSRDQSGSLDRRLIVAGGGGGSGEGRFCGYPVSPLLLGGTGGHAGSDGGDGADGALCVDDRSLQTGEDPFYTAGGTGGEAGSQSAGGLGGSPLGQSGSLGLGGNGGALVIGGIGGGIRGGGGGGGLFGGGGGGSIVPTPDIRGDAAPAGGGGGGSNLVPTDGTAEVADADSGPSITISYTETEVYDFQGFFSPVDNPEVLNKAKAGSAIPVKFSLGADQGLDIFATGSPASRQIACDSTDALDALEETVTAGSSSLSYDATTDRYTYVWKTNKGWANTCRELVVKLDDGTEHVADFKFVK